MSLTEDLRQRILIIDGAMGTMIQQYKLSEADFRGDEYKGWALDIKGNNDILSVTKPEVITAIHLEYLESGADIIETNTFSSTVIAQADYHMEQEVDRMNAASVLCAKEAIKQYQGKSGDSRTKYIAGAIGPLNKTLSISPDVNDPGFRAVTFDEVEAAYYQQIKVLCETGVDMLLIETIFDTLNAKAAIFACKRYFNDAGKKWPIMISGTITDASGRTLSGQVLEAFYTSVMHAEPVSVGLNCALGAREMRPHIEELSGLADCFVSAYPNAGLPNAFGEYDELPAETASIIQEWAKSGFVNMVGGCCGTTPAHIRAIAGAVKDIAPRHFSILEEA